MLQRNFDSGDHGFLFLDASDETLPETLPVNSFFLSTKKFSFDILKTLKILFCDSQHIIWHGIFLGLKFLFMLKLCRFAEDKYIWISQGTDLYNWKRNGKKGSPAHKIKAMMFNRMGDTFRKRISYFGCAFPSDKYFYEKSVNPHGRMFDVSYMDSTWTDLIQTHTSEQTSDTLDIKYASGNNEPLKIMVGFNASPLNGHNMILNSLVNLRYENIRIYIPLWKCTNWYQEYVDDVCSYAELMYGEKVVCVTDLERNEDFVDLLKQVDIVVNRTDYNAPHCHDIYENTLTALALGKPVYLSNKSSLFRHFKRNKILVYEAESIYNSEFESLLDETCAHHAVPSQLEALQKECAGVEAWKKLFYSVEHEHDAVKFLHIIRPSEELATPMIEIVYNNFDINEHQFLINRRIPLCMCERLMRYSNVNLFLVGQTKLKRIRYMYNRLKKAEHVIWHGFYAGYGKPILDVRELLLVSAFPELLKKTTWVGWGSDIYDWRADLSKLKGLTHMKAKVLNRLSLKARLSVPNFVSVFPPDADKFREEFGDSARIYDGTYSNLQFREILEETRPNKHRTVEHPVKIMVGHSANCWNYHIQILNDLAKYRYENIRIYIPLSTGVDHKYRLHVQQYAQMLFGKKAVCINKKLPLRNYIRLLWNMDIAVFRLDRQAALGNLMNLFYMGKKVYLPADTIMYDFFKAGGVPVHDINQLGTLSFDDFTRNEHIPVPQYIHERTDTDRIVEKWRLIFDEVSKEM